MPATMAATAVAATAVATSARVGEAPTERERARAFFFGAAAAAEARERAKMTQRARDRSVSEHVRSSANRERLRHRCVFVGARACEREKTSRVHVSIARVCRLLARSIRRYASARSSPKMCATTRWTRARVSRRCSRLQPCAMLVCGARAPNEPQGRRSATRIVSARALRRAAAAHQHAARLPPPFARRVASREPTKASTLDFNRRCTKTRCNKSATEATTMNGEPR